MLRMRKGEAVKSMILLGGMALVLMGARGLGADSYTGRYKKTNGLVDMQMLSDQRIKFRLNTVVGMHPCNIGEEGDAEAIIEGSNRAVFKDDNKCEIEFTFENDRLKVTTSNECNGYCGMKAVGSMDGLYSKKSDTPVW